MTLRKKDLIENLYLSCEFQRKESLKIIEAIFEMMKRTLVSGDDILISGFGKFCVKNKKQRKGRNPATGDDMILDARKVVIFNCSGLLKDKINGKLSD